MKTTEYLYGCSPESFRTMPYERALGYKNEMAARNLTRLMELHYQIRDFAHIREVNAAVIHNRRLLDEMKSYQ